MILHFINISKQNLAGIFIILISVLVSNYSFSKQNNTFFLPDKSGYISWECEAGICTLYLNKKNSNQSILLEKVPSPSIEPLGNSLIKLFFNCGSPCNYTFFYDSKIGLSQPFEFEVAVDAGRKVVVVAQENDLAAYKIFDKQKKILFSISRNWSPTVALYNNIIGAKFIENSLRVEYLEGKDFKEKTEVFHDIIK